LRNSFGYSRCNLQYFFGTLLLRTHPKPRFRGSSSFVDLTGGVSPLLEIHDHLDADLSLTFREKFAQIRADQIRPNQTGPDQTDV
jgi:hypothetical protein